MKTLPTARRRDGNSSTAKARGADHSRDDMPLGDYAGLVALFTASLAAFLAARRDKLPDRFAMRDLLLLGLAAQKLSRVASRSRVASPLRAPFTKYERSAGKGEVEEEPRGRGLRRTIGELVTCPYCLGTWISSGLVCGFILNAKVTRAVAGIFAVGSIADFIQCGYAKLRDIGK